MEPLDNEDKGEGIVGEFLVIEVTCDEEVFLNNCMDEKFNAIAVILSVVKVFVELLVLVLKVVNVALLVALKRVVILVDDVKVDVALGVLVIWVVVVLVNVK